MRKKEPRRFTFEKVQSKSRWKGFVLGFVAFVLVFGIAAGAYLYTRTDLLGSDQLMGLFEKQTDDADALHGSGKSATILLMSISSAETLETEKKEIYFLVLARADTKEGQIRFCPLPVKDSYLDCYEAGGEPEIVAALEKEYKIKIDRYVSSNENTFALAINYLGGLQYTVPQNVTYRTKDLTLIITSGYQTIKGETLLKYLKYYKETDLPMQGELFCKMIENFLTKDNLENAMPLYKGLMQNMADTTDISYVDTADNLNDLRVIAENLGNNAVTVASVEAL